MRSIGREAAIVPPGSTDSSALTLLRAGTFVKVPPGQAVLRRDDRRFRAEQRGNFGGDAGDLMRLHRENDAILRGKPADPVSRRYWRLRDFHRAVVAVFDEAQAVGLYCRQMGAARDDRNFLPDAAELDGEKSADDPAPITQILIPSLRFAAHRRRQRSDPEALGRQPYTMDGFVAHVPRE